MSEHAFLYVICRHGMKTMCRPSDRDVNWRSPVQGARGVGGGGGAGGGGVCVGGGAGGW